MANENDVLASKLIDETAAYLRRDYGDVKAVEATLFLFANRAYEAALPEKSIWQALGTAIARAGYSEVEEERVLDLFEHIAGLAAKVHSNS